MARNGHFGRLAKFAGVQGGAGTPNNTREPVRPDKKNPTSYGWVFDMGGGWLNAERGLRQPFRTGANPCEFP